MKKFRKFGKNCHIFWIKLFKHVTYEGSKCIPFILSKVVSLSVPPFDGMGIVLDGVDDEIEGIYYDFDCGELVGRVNNEHIDSSNKLNIDNYINELRLKGWK